MRQRVRRGEVVAVGTVHLRFQRAQDARANEREDEVDDHRDRERLKVPVVCAGDALGGVEQLHGADDRQHAGVLDVDDEVVADLRHDIAQRLRQHDVDHCLEVRHADGLGALGLAGVDRQDAAADGLRHIGAGVDGNDEERCRPHVHVDPEQHGRAVIDEHRLHHHRGAAEHFNVDVQDDPHETEQPPFDGVLLPVGGDRLHDADEETDDQTDEGRNHGDHHCHARAAQERHAVILKDKDDFCAKGLRHECQLLL